MAYFNTKYYSNTDSYSDGDIENDIYDIVKGKRDILDFSGNYAVFYHLSPIRENILNWYPFDKDAVCLEIGAGCGAITGLLCQSLKKVVSVDISKRRSEINYERHKSCDNLEIICGNVHEINFNEKFDYIILNGVFEYALSFTHTQKDPYGEFLKFVASLLNEKGRIIIAIENRLGLKYFNGGVEDHTNQYFLGLNNYENNSSVRTFTKSELSVLIEKCGFESYKFYYPYPDYKFPSEIFSDSSINTYKYGRPYYNLNNKNLTLFNEQKVCEALSNENITDVFSNSFLVEISCNKELSDVIYAKINTDRNDKFKIATVISEKNNTVVEKIALNNEAQQHIDNIYNNSKIKFSDKMEPAPVIKTKKGIQYDFCDYPNLDDIVLNCIQEERYGEVVEIIKKLFEPLILTANNESYFNEDFKSIFGSKKPDIPLSCIKPANIDLILDNVMVNGDKYIIIDTEWILDLNVPILFIIWRTIRELYTKHSEIAEKLTFEAMLSEFNIDSDLSQVFEAWALSFVNNYVGCGNIEKFAVKRNNAELSNYYYLMFNDCQTSLYINKGEGYSEDNKIFTELNVSDDGSFKLELQLTDGTEEIRWDPVESRCCKCRIDYINGDIKAVNAEAVDDEGYDVFNNNDPQYIIVPNEDRLVIKGSIFIADIVTSANILGNKMTDYKGELDFKNTVLDSVNQQAEELRANVSRLSDLNIGLNDRIDESNKSQEYLVRQIEKLNTQLKNEKMKYNEIINSKGWKILDIMRKFIVLFRR